MLLLYRDTHTAGRPFLGVLSGKCVESKAAAGARCVCFVRDASAAAGHSGETLLTVCAVLEKCMHAPTMPSCFWVGDQFSKTVASPPHTRDD